MQNALGTNALATRPAAGQLPGWIGKARMAGKYLGPVGTVIGGGLDFADGKAQGEDDIRAGAGALGSAGLGTAGMIAGGVVGGPIGGFVGGMVGSTVGGFVGDRVDELVRGNAGIQQQKQMEADANLQREAESVLNQRKQQLSSGQTLTMFSENPQTSMANQMQQLGARRQQELNQGQNYYDQFMR
jgi:hypothetical protein